MDRPEKEMIMIRQQINKLHKQGFSKRAIARKLGISRLTVKKYARSDQDVEDDMQSEKMLMNRTFEYPIYDEKSEIYKIISKYRMDWTVYNLNAEKIQNIGFQKIKNYLDDDKLHDELRNNKLDLDYIIFLLFYYFSMAPPKIEKMERADGIFVRSTYITLMGEFRVEFEKHNSRGRRHEHLLWYFILTLANYIKKITGKRNPKLLYEISKYHPDWYSAWTDKNNTNPIQNYLKGHTDFMPSFVTYTTYKLKNLRLRNKLIQSDEKRISEIEKEHHKQKIKTVNKILGID